MSEKPSPDERYVKICNVTKERGVKVREDMLIAIEKKNDFKRAFACLEELRRLDTIHMVAMKMGVEIAEKEAAAATSKKE